MPTNFPELVNIFFKLIQKIIPLLMATAFLVFFWGVVKFISKAGDEKAVTEGKKLIIWGLLALFIMISLWGILRFLFGELGLDGNFGLPFLPPRRIQ